jgi:hypothetical protein
MKHPTDVPNRQIMRFFTPELYVQFNSSDDEVADRANERWEKALEEYKRHLESIQTAMPSQVKEVSALCLHDAEVLGFQQEHHAHRPAHWPFPQPPIWSAVAIVTLKQDLIIRSLIYLLWDTVREHPAGPDWQFSKLCKNWLYDEVDVSADGQGAFLHRILFSDGTIVEIPFESVFTATVTLPSSTEGKETTRRIA